MDKRNWVILILILIIIIIVIIFCFCCNYDAKANIESFIENVANKGLNSLIEEYSGEKVSKKNNGAKQMNEVIVSDNNIEEAIEIETEIPDAFLRDTRVSMDFPESGVKRSKGEQICKKVLEKIFKTKFSRIRPDWLKNPKSGRNLELDCFSASAGRVYGLNGIACEYNGQQHYRHVWPNYFNMTKEQFLAQVERDKFKLDACDANNVYLIIVPYNVKNELIPQYIEYMLPHNVQRRREMQLSSS